MLVLSRKLGEAIVVMLPDGRLVTVEVHRIRRTQVSLAIDAPPEIAVHRSEVAEQVFAEEGRR